MKIKILSDLHTEFGYHPKFNEIFSNKDVDLYIMAGDLSNSDGITQSLRKVDSLLNVPLLYVPGNHCYYGTSKSMLDKKFKSQKFKNVYIMNDRVFALGDTIFIGSTGWMDEQPSAESLRSLNDFRLIKDIIPYGETWGRRSKQFFKKELQRYKNKKVVCISHNMPTHRVIDDQFKGSPINQCFANHWDDLIHTYNPKYFICGHTHSSIDQIVYNTRIICNPFGYLGREENPKFDTDLVIDI